MSNGYEVSFNKSPGQTILSGDFNNEFTALDTAFHETNGHTHDGTPGEGGPIATVQSSNGYNKVNIDAGNNEIEFHVNVSSAAVEQVKIKDGVIEPTTDNDIDLGSATKEFKDLYIDGTANIDSLVADTVDINGGTIDGTTIGGSVPAVGTFTTLNASSVDINGGTLNDVTIGTTSSATLSLLTVTGNSSLHTVLPAADNTYDLGFTNYEWRDLYVDGTAYIDTAQITAATITTTDINSGTIDDTAITGGTIDGTAITGGTIDGTAITDGTIDGAVINGGTIGLTSIVTTAKFGNVTSSNVTTTGNVIAQGLGVFTDGVFGTTSTTEYLLFDPTNLLKFYTNSTERLRIDASGNVGIGTTNPGTYKLYINGNLGVSGNTQLGAVTTLIGNGSEGGELRLNDKNNSTLTGVLDVDGSGNIRIYSPIATNIQFGVSASPGSALNINSSNEVQVYGTLDYKCTTVTGKTITTNFIPVKVNGVTKWLPIYDNP